MSTIISAAEAFHQHISDLLEDIPEDVKEKAIQTQVTFKDGRSIAGALRVAPPVGGRAYPTVGLYELLTVANGKSDTGEAFQMLASIRFHADSILRLEFFQQNAAATGGMRGLASVSDLSGNKIVPGRPSGLIVPR